MEPRLEGPSNIPSDIGCVSGLELTAETSKRFSGGRTQLYLKWGNPPKQNCTHLAGYPPKLPSMMEEYCSLLQCSMLGTSGTCDGAYMFPPPQKKGGQAGLFSIH